MRFKDWYQKRRLSEMSSNMSPHAIDVQQGLTDLAGIAMPSTVSAAKGLWNLGKATYGAYKSGGVQGIKQAYGQASNDLAKQMFAKDGTGDPAYDLPDEYTDGLNPQGKKQVLQLVGQAKQQTSPTSDPPPGFGAATVQQHLNQTFSKFLGQQKQLPAKTSSNPPNPAKPASF
jgi:hypothetical protein